MGSGGVLEGSEGVLEGSGGVLDSSERVSEGTGGVLEGSKGYWREVRGTDGQWRSTGWQ